MSIPLLDLAAMHAEVRPELERAWSEVVATCAFVGGPHVERFEREWADACRRRHAVGVGNGTDAIALVLRALGIGPGDEVIVPASTFVATAEAVSAVGATPVFADVDPDTLLLTADTAAPHIGPRTAAVVPVHLYGQIAGMDALVEMASRAGIAVVEDAAQAHAATSRGRPPGSFGVAATFSFYPGKNLGAFGDGGAVVTDDEALAERIRSLANHGRAATSNHRHEVVGGNSRLDGLQAAVLSVKLARLAEWTERRRAAARRYDDALAGSPVRPVTVVPDAASSRHLYVVRVGDRDAFRAALDRSGVATGVHYAVPCHRQPAYAGSADCPLPVAEVAAAQVVSLPMYPHLDLAAVDTVCAAALAAAERVGSAALP